MDLNPRVLQVVLSLNPGGTERLVVELCRRLHPEMPTMVCCLDEAGAWAAELESAGIGVQALARRPGFRPRLAAAIASVARTHRATVVHAHQYSPFVYTCLSQALRRTPLVFSEHGRLSDAGPSTRRRLANYALRLCPSRVFAVSDELADHLANEGFSRRSIDIVYNGIAPGPPADIEARARLRQELGVSPDTFVVGTVARLDPVKDLETLLTAVARMTEQRQVRLVIVGDGGERTSLEAAARRLGIAHAVRFLGMRDDARSWLWAFDAYANSSVSEGVSLTILEAMAASLPVVATRVGGTPEVLDETCGRLVPARQPEALAAALSLLAGDAGLRARLGHEARLRLESRFTIDRMVQEYSDVYRRVS